MSGDLGNLGDFFPETEVKCRIRGCENRIHVSREEVIQRLASGHSPRTERMCEECFALLKTLEDKELPCSTAGCQGTWVWNRYAQLEAIRRSGKKTPPSPRGFCQSCKDAASQVEAKEMPCRMHGCKNTWTWTAREQIASAGKQPLPRYCDVCYELLKPLKDMALPCRIKGCTHTVTWTRYQQLEHLRAGKTLDNPPHRMCEDCFKVFSSLKNEQRPCKINGCKGTWLLTAYEQLELLKNTPEGQEPAMPVRMCKDCFDFFSSAKDIEMPCQNKACSNTWVWTRSMQLGAHVHGNAHPKARLCDSCMAAFMTLKDEERPCSVQGCTGTWIYTANAQILDKCNQREEPKRRCAACQDFLQNHAPEELVCEKCGKAFSWSAQEQLQVHLGVFAKPTLCSSCATEQIAAVSPKEEPVIVNRRMIRIPSAGPWNNDPVVCERPRCMTHELIEAMENSKCRVVCLGDEMTLSLQESGKDWPALLNGKLTERFGAEAGIAVFNAGMAGCTTARGLVRIGRDVLPFAPKLVVFSFAWADAKCDPRKPLGQEALNERLVQVGNDIEAFIQAMNGKAFRLLCWLPNPVYPMDSTAEAFDQEAFKAWVDTQGRFYDSVLNKLRMICRQHDIPVVDARAMFEIDGSKSAQRWMQSWFMHNDQGADNIASWLKDAICSGKLLED